MAGSCALPLPVNDANAVGSDALLTKEKLSDALPLARGVKVTAADTLEPAGIVTGNETPLRVNSEMRAAADEMVTGAPKALTAAVKLLLCPKTRGPKFRATGAIANTPAAKALPDKEIMSFAFELSETTPNIPAGATGRGRRKDYSEGKVLKQMGERTLGFQKSGSSVAAPQDRSTKQRNPFVPFTAVVNPFGPSTITSAPGQDRWWGRTASQCDFRISIGNHLSESGQGIGSILGLRSSLTVCAGLSVAS